jgi:hypothetical protein
MEYKGRIGDMVVTNGRRLGKGTSPTRGSCSRAYGGASPVATRVRAWRRRTTNDVKRRFCPWRACKTTGAATARYCSFEHPHNST